MASKKSIRKTSAKNPLKVKPAVKKKAVAKKSKAKPATKSVATKKKAKPAKPTAKKKAPVTAVARKKKVAKKVASKKAKEPPKKKVVKSVSKAKTKRSVKKKTSAQKIKGPIPKTKGKSSLTKKPRAKRSTPAVPAAQPVSKAAEPLLSSTERYNIGGLFACAIERRHDPEWSRLRAVLRHMDLTTQEKDNLIRLSEGFMIPKLFAENLPDPKLNQLLADLVKFGLRQGDYEKYWREEIQQIGFWLGVFPAQFQAIEQQVKR